MPDFSAKLLLRMSNRIELFLLYFSLFSFLILLLFIERTSADSDVLMRYFRYVIEYRTIFILTLSTIALLFHYRFLTIARVEVNCRVLVGDTVRDIKIRYFIELFSILILCFILSTIFSLAFSFPLLENIYLFIILSAYIILSSYLLRKK